MPEFSVEKVMDRSKVANTINTILDWGTDTFGKPKMDKEDHAKMKLMRNMSSILNSAVSMIQQETVQQRNVLIIERMKQLGYEPERAKLTE